MFQKGEYEAAGAFLEEFDHTFPASPLAPDVMLLHAMINLKSCKFDEVRATLDKFVQVYGPIEAQVATLLKDPGKRARALPAAAQQGVDRHAARSDRRSAQGRPALLQVLRRRSGARSRGGHHPQPGGDLGRADRAPGRQDRRGGRDRGGAPGPGRRVAAPAGRRRSRDGGAGQPARRRGAPGGAAQERHQRPVRQGGGGDAGAGGRGAASCARIWSPPPASSPPRRWSISTSVCAISSGRRASPRSTPSSARRRSWRSRSSTCATAATRLSCSPPSSLRV